MNSLKNILFKISNNYLDVKKEEFTGHNHAKFIRDSSKEIIKLKYEFPNAPKRIASRVEEYKSRAKC